MRPARVLNLFISSILPPSHVQKLPSKLPWTCLGCGRFKWKPFRSLSSYSKVSTAEPCISIIKLAQQGRSQEALVMYLKLVEEERRPSQEALYQLAQTLYKSNHLVGMQALHNTLFIHPLSDRTRRSLIYVHIMFINLIARTTRDMQAIQQLCELVSDSVKAGNPVIYNTLIKVFLENGERLKAEQAYEKLKQNGKPTIVTFDIWMKEAERQKDYKAMIYYLDEMNYFGVSPDRRMVFRVVSVLCETSQFYTAKKFIEELHMEAKTLVPKNLKKKLLMKIADHRQRTNRHRKSYSVNNNKINHLT